MFKRLFIAVKINPSEEFLRWIYFLQSNLSHELINWIRADHYHLTLQFLGKIHAGRVDDILEIMGEIASKNERIQLNIGGLKLFGSKYQPRVLWLDIEESAKLIYLHKDISLALKKKGFLINGQNYIPHISLARVKKIGDRAFFQSLIEKQNPNVIQQILFKEMILFESILSTKGAEYKMIKKYEMLA